MSRRRRPAVPVRSACLVLLVAALAAALLAGPAQALDAPALRTALAQRSSTLGPASGGYVVNLDTGAVLFSRAPDRKLVPASNEKLFTTAAALLRFGPTATLDTTVRVRPGVLIDEDGVLDGDLYLVGAGDPSLGDRGLTALANQLAQQAGLEEVTGGVRGDEAVFDTLRGSYDTGGRPSLDLGGWLSGLAYAHGRARPGGPAAVAAARLQALLKAKGVTFGRRARTGAIGTVGGDDEAPLASTSSPTIAALAASTNVPSDNFYAEMLLKGLGASFGTAGTTAAGALVARETLEELGVEPTIYDGSGLARSNRTSPRQVVALLRAMRESEAADAFIASLALPGRTGTLRLRMRGTAAAGRCPAKTGTLRDVSALSGYCRTAGGLVAFSFLENGVSTYRAKQVEDGLVATLARYTG